MIGNKKIFSMEVVFRLNIVIDGLRYPGNKIPLKAVKSNVKRMGFP